jgi:hypothetical protein
VSEETARGPKYPHIPKPARRWTDKVARCLRKNPALRKLHYYITDELVTFLFALLAALPGAVILLFYIPKFIRNRMRRHKYEVRLVFDAIQRIKSEEVGEVKPAD